MFRPAINGFAPRTGPVVSVAEQVALVQVLLQALWLFSGRRTVGTLGTTGPQRRNLASPVGKKKDRPCTYDVKVRGFRATAVAVEK